MIENESALTREDWEFIVRDIYRQADRRAITVVRLLGGLSCLGNSGWQLVQCILAGSFDGWSVVSIVLSLGLAVVLLFPLPFRVSRAAAKAMAMPESRLPRRYCTDNEGITVEIASDGIASKQHFAYHLVNAWATQEDVVYVRITLDKKGFYFLCFHDDGYAQGSRDALLALLQGKGIPQI